MLVEKRSRDQRPSHEFSLVLDADFAPFIALVDKRVEVVSMIARGLGDSRPTYVRVTRLVRGSVNICWTNSSLLPAVHLRYLGVCPVQVRSTVCVFVFLNSCVFV